MKNFSYLLGFLLLLNSCKKENSIQTFFVEHQERPDYSVVDISATLLDLENSNLNNEEKEAYNSLNKLQVLMYKATDSTQDAYKTELKAINKVFKNKEYPELMVFRDNGTTFKIHTVGQQEQVDEILVLTSSKTMGFLAIRVIGNNMDANKMATLATKIQANQTNNKALKSIMDFLK